jgi:L-aminopeptidase/D-esterase-like protein
MTHGKIIPSFLPAMWVLIAIPLSLPNHLSAQQPSNDTVDLVPSPIPDGPELSFDFPGLSVGVAEYAEGPTGCTVITFDKRARATADVRGGSVGTHEVARLMGTVAEIDAICLAGGSAYGLEAATGVAAEYLAARSYSKHWTQVALVPGAIIYDYSRRENSIFADKALGRAAFRARRSGVFPLGPVGAGRMASVGSDRESSGQGAAFRRIGDVRIAAFTVVNALGAVVDRSGTVIRGNRSGVERVPSVDGAIERLTGASASAPSHGNTTLTVVITNVVLSNRQLRQLGNQAHTSMARAIQPFHTEHDGDVLFAVSTGELSNDRISGIDLGIVASELLWDAVIAAVSQEPR